MSTTEEDLKKIKEDIESALHDVRRERNSIEPLTAAQIKDRELAEVVEGFTELENSAVEEISEDRYATFKALENMDWSRFRELTNRLADATGEYAGIPIIIGDMQLHIEDRHPHKRELERVTFKEDVEMRFTIGDVEKDPQDGPPPRSLVNEWYSHVSQGWVVLYKEGKWGWKPASDHPEEDAFVRVPMPLPDAKIKFYIRPKYRYVDRLDLWLNTISAFDAWDMKAELTAMNKLRELVPERIFEMYFLTGCFFETSKKSRITYLFRRGRPTIAMVGCDHNDDEVPMKVLAVMCLHPIGYYGHSWAGCMVPTDDLISHLLLMRGDEAYFWRKANQHDPDSPEAGI